MLVDLTVAPGFHGIGLFEALAQQARRSFESPSGFIFTYSPLFLTDRRYWVIQRHERLGAKLTRELQGSRSGLTMTVDGQQVLAEDVGIAAYTID